MRNDYDYHHIRSTELANGRIAYKLCNIARGNRDTFDPCTMCHLLPPDESQTGTTGAEN